ncbi:melanopsin-B-like [Amphiura filiformis]|uniref:melanopsin-B-like n=1 Tax=Amphiura filiformis TaxID=82378 RepID=UPI003B226F1E
MYGNVTVYSKLTWTKQIQIRTEEMMAEAAQPFTRPNFRTKSLRIPPNVMIINLAISDLLLNITLPPMMFISVVNRYFLFGDTGCKLDGFCGALFGISSISNLTVIAIDRCYSLEKLNSISYHRAFAMVGLVWIYSFIWAILPFVGIGEYVLEGYHVSCTFQYLNQSIRNKIYVGCLYCGAFVFPVSVIGICYWKMYQKVKATRKTLISAVAGMTGIHRGGCSGKNRPKGLSMRGVGKYTTSKRKSIDDRWRGQKLELQIARVGAFLTILFVVSWTPYATVALIGQYINPDLVTPLSQTIPVVFAKCSAAWDPFVYAIKHTSFRSALRSQFGKKTRQRVKRNNKENDSKAKLDDVVERSSSKSKDLELDEGELYPLKA